MVEYIDAPSESILVTFTSPAFKVYPLTLRNKHLIPSSVYSILSPTWERPSFDEKEVHIFELEDVYVAEEGLVFDTNGRLYSITVTQHSGEEIQRACDAVEICIRSRPVVATGDYVLLKKRGIHNYGHWIAEMYPKAYFAKSLLPLNNFKYLVAPVSGRLLTVVEKTLSMIGIESDRRVVTGSEPLFVRRLVVVDGLSNHGVFMSPLILMALDSINMQIKARETVRILVSRRSLPSRRFVNEDQIEEKFIANGFHVVDPGLLSLEEQIATFKSAQLIVGAMGAGMTNIIFSSSEAQVVNLAPASMPDTFFWFISTILGQRYTEIRCEQVGTITGIMPWDTAINISQDDLDYIFSL